jgi:hypothetical protein
MSATTDRTTETRTVWACWHVEKLATVDEYEKGCIGQPWQVLYEPANITVPTLPELVKAIEYQYGLNFDSLWIPDHDSGFIGFNQLETADSAEPTDREREEWKAGRLKLYLCDYRFQIEKRTIEEPATEDMREILTAAGIKCHS